MALTTSIRDTDRKGPAEQCIHCCGGWIYEPTEDTLEDEAMPCHMCGAIGSGHRPLPIVPHPAARALRCSSTVAATAAQATVASAEGATGHGTGCGGRLTIPCGTRQGRP
jgi:hypothetical protein